MPPASGLVEQLRHETRQGVLTHHVDGQVGTLLKQLRADLHPLNENMIEHILRPLREFLEDTRELVKLDRVHAELESRIIKPVERAQARASKLAVLFGIVGFIAAAISLIGLLFNWQSQHEQRALVIRQEQLVREMEKGIVNEMLENREYLENLEKKVDEMISNNNIAKLEEIMDQPVTDDDESEAVAPRRPFDSGILREPTVNLAIALATQDSDLALAAAKQIRDGSFGVEEQAMAAATVAVLNPDEGIKLIVDLWNGHRSEISPAEARLLAGGAVRYYERRDNAEEGEILVMEMAEYVENHPKSSDEDKAFMWNQLGKLTNEYDLERSEKFQLKAIDLYPPEPSYHHNLSIIYERMGKIDEAIAAAEEALARQGNDKDGDHYAQAIDVHLKKLEGFGTADSAERINTETRLGILLRELKQVDRGLWAVKVAMEKRLRELSPE